MHSSANIILSVISKFSHIVAVYDETSDETLISTDIKLTFSWLPSLSPEYKI